MTRSDNRGAAKSGDEGAAKTGGEGAARSGADTAAKVGAGGAAKTGGDSAAKTGGESTAKSCVQPDQAKALGTAPPNSSFGQYLWAELNPNAAAPPSAMRQGLLERQRV